MIKYSQIPRVIVHKSWQSLFKNVSETLEKLHKASTDKIRAGIAKKG